MLANSHFFLYQNVKIIELAVSLGGVQSLIEVAGAMTHPEKYITAADREEGGLSESLVRFRFVCWICMKIRGNRFCNYQRF